MSSRQGGTPTAPQGGAAALADMMNQMNAFMNMAKAMLGASGIDFYVYKVVLHIKEEQSNSPVDEDCPDARLCIDYIFRLRCATPDVCSNIKQRILAQARGQQPQAGGNA